MFLSIPDGDYYSTMIQYYSHETLPLTGNNYESACYIYNGTSYTALDTRKYYYNTQWINAI